MSFQDWIRSSRLAKIASSIKLFELYLLPARLSARWHSRFHRPLHRSTEGAVQDTEAGTDPLLSLLLFVTLSPERSSYRPILILLFNLLIYLIIADNSLFYLTKLAGIRQQRGTGRHGSTRRDRSAVGGERGGGTRKWTNPRNIGSSKCSKWAQHIRSVKRQHRLFWRDYK